MDKYKILFVDDEPEILKSHRRNFRDIFDVKTAESGKDALVILKKYGPFPVIVSDMRMPKMSGSELLKEVFEVSPNTTRILLTGKSDFEDTISAINDGHIFRFLSKPCPAQTLKSAIKDGVGQYNLIRSERVLLEKTLRGSIKLMNDVLEMSKPSEFSRASRVKKIAHDIMSKISPKDCWKMDIVSTLAHLGCLTIPREIMRRKENGEVLSKQELLIYAHHTEIGYKLISNIPRLTVIAEAIKYQEKNYDGTGYPVDKVEGEKIPLMSRIVRIAYDFDIYISNGTSRIMALEKMQIFESHYYDKEILDALMNVIIEKEQEDEIIKYVNVKDLCPGMILQEDVKAMNGAVLVTSRHEVTEILILKLIKYHESGKLSGKIKVSMIVE